MYVKFLCDYRIGVRLWLKKILKSRRLEQERRSIGLFLINVVCFLFFLDSLIFFFALNYLYLSSSIKVNKFYKCCLCKIQGL